MTEGLVFDIKEFAIHDGPGIRTTVFLKGCPLACMWCHNPEGQSSQPQVIHSPVGARVVGTIYTPQGLAAILNQQADILRNNEGGITFSGGEPLLQADFVCEVIDLLDNTHVLLDTSGYSSESAFRRVVKRVDLVFFDLKLVDPIAHQHFTGRGNASILHNLHTMNEMAVPFVIRVPLIPGVTDTVQNLSDIAQVLKSMPGLQKVHLLPYNKAAGAKYEYAGMRFKPDYDESRPLNRNTAVFEETGIKVEIV